MNEILRAARREFWYIVSAGLVVYGISEIFQYLDKVLR